MFAIKPTQRFASLKAVEEVVEPKETYRRRKGNS